MGVKLVVLGWDSATFDVVDPLLEAGRLPALQSVLERGVRAPLRSVWPPMTDCAWTSAFTGRNPGAHGIFGSWYRAPGAYACRYFSSRDRRAPALWEFAADSRFLVWNVPMTYPPSPVPGAMVAGYGAPPGGAICEPKELQKEIERRWPLGDLLDRAPHGDLRDFLDDLVRGLEAQPEAIAWAAERAEADCVAAVWPHVDRAQHFFWRMRGTDHALAGAVDHVYQAMDRATGALLEKFPDANFLIVSDHGAGRLRGDVNLGAWLTHRGYAAPGKQQRHLMSRVAWAMPPPVRRFGRRLLPGLANRTFGASLSGQLGPFDWSRTQAFVGFHGDLWLNLAGREQEGTVKESEAASVRDELVRHLLDLQDPRTGDNVFAAVHKRDEVYAGDAIDLAPDLVLDSWSAGYRVAPRRDPAGDLVTDPMGLSGVNEAWSSDHRPVGILAAAGPGIAAGDVGELSLMDVCPTALALLGEPVPDDLDGSPGRAILSDEFLAAHPISSGGTAGGRETGGEYSEAEAAAVAEHLKDLGYIE